MNPKFIKFIANTIFINVEFKFEHIGMKDPDALLSE